MSGNYLVLGGPSAPSLDKRKWRGSFVIPDALPGIPYGDGRRIWTPAYGCYDDYWRARIREEFATRGYTHFVYNCAGLPYGDHYPELADDVGRVLRDLVELQSAGLVPVVCATDDRFGGRLATSFMANAQQIPICFPGWEFNGWLDTEGMKQCILDTREAAPDADCYIHFTPGHGSISHDEMGGWRWCQDNDVVGLLSQDDHWRDPQGTGEGLEGTALRLAGKMSGWEGMHLLNVAFEQCTTPVYHDWWGWNEDAQIEFAREMLTYCPSVAGFCDGGPTR
jgi:hypothetical protein